MKRLRLIAVAALAVASLGLGAPPASACQPDGPCPCSDEPTRSVYNAVNNVWNGLTGRDLIHCTF